MVTPLLWVGEQPPRCITEEHEKVMDSVINYYYPTKEDTQDIKVPYKYEKLFLDNGAYTALYQGKELDAERVLDLQERINPDFTIPLDYPYKPGMERKEMDKRWMWTKENILYWQESSSLEIIPSLHAVGTQMMVNSIQWLQKKCDSDFIAVGSVITRYSSMIKISEKFNGFFGDRQPSKQLVDTMLFVGQMTRKYSDFDVHIMGFGSSPMTYHLSVYCGVHSTDCSGHRRKAAFGKIILPQTGERYVCNRGAKFGIMEWKAEDVEKLIECNCPVCSDMPHDFTIRKEKLASDWKLRAIHNKRVMEEEEKKAKELIEDGLDVYEKFLDKIFKRSSLKYMFEYAKRMQKQSRVEMWGEW
jgi:queuine/archaeosine tRNA-ribosyltransferase